MRSLHILSTLALLSTYLPHTSADGLNTRAKAAGKLYFGSATDNGELSDAPYKAQLGNLSDFGQITPGNSIKWESTEPSRGTFTYKNGDVIANLAETNGQLLRCHTLVWHSQLPSWVSAGKFDNATLIAIMQTHIANVAGHYKGRCYAWDVVNEALNEDGTYRSSVFYDTIGPAFIPLAFKAATQADPGAKLYYNDYNLELPGAKSTAARDIVRMIRAYGGRIDGIGAQAHLIVGSVGASSTLQTNIEGFTTLDVDFSYTELDIRSKTPMSEATKIQQDTDYAAVVTACRNVVRCVGVTVWDWTDKYSWIPGVFTGEGEALPWDANLIKKSAYGSILRAWGGASTVPSASSGLPASTVTSDVASPTKLAQRWE